MSQPNIPLDFSYYQTFDGELTEGFRMATKLCRLEVTAQRHSFNSFIVWTRDADVDDLPVKAPDRMTLSEALFAAASFCGVVGEVG